ncbi:MAG: hypothetical protein WA705_19360 [Candidatus Ozemobacteraceae bacterium]
MVNRKKLISGQRQTIRNRKLLPERGQKSTVRLSMKIMDRSRTEDIRAEDNSAKSWTAKFSREVLTAIGSLDINRK